MAAPETTAAQHPAGSMLARQRSRCVRLAASRALSNTAAMLSRKASSLRLTPRAGAASP